MQDNLTLGCCENFKIEIEFLIKTLGINDVKLFIYPSDCINCVKNKYAYLKVLIKENKANSNNIMLSIFEYNNNMSATKAFELCHSLLIGNSLAQSFVAKGYYLITPGWLRNWKYYVIKSWGFNEETIKIFFKESFKKLLLLDSLVYENIEENLKDFSNFVDMECEILPVGIDYFKSNFLNIYHNWKLENLDKTLKHKVSQVTDFALIFDFTEKIATLLRMEDLIDNIFQLFVMMVGASKLAFLPVGKNIKRNIKTYMGIIYESELEQLKEDGQFEEFKLTTTGKGFILKLSFNHEILGYLEIEDIPFPSYIDRYLELSKTVSRIFSLAIFNARIYEKLITANSVADNTIIERTKELKKSLSLLQSTIESTTDAIAVIDNVGKISTYNKNFLKLWSISEENISNITFEKLCAYYKSKLEHPSEFYNMLLKINHDKEIILNQLMELKNHRIIECYSQPVKGEELSNSRIWSFKDVTERISSINEIKKAKEEAENANKAKTNFLANMSHEIRTPMTGIMGMTDLAILTNSSEEQKEYLKIVKSSSKALLTILNDILDYTKFEAGKINLSNAEFNLEGMINETLKLFNVVAEQKKLYILVNIDKSIPEKLKGDNVRLRQILSNLIGNSIKFTSRGGVTLDIFCLKLVETHVELKFVVSDTGIGISQDKFHLLFQRFSQVEDSISKSFGGTGLGLAISQKLVEIMGGKIYVESEEGVGSKFFFTLKLEVST